MGNPVLRRLFLFFLQAQAAQQVGAGGEKLLVGQSVRVRRLPASDRHTDTIAASEQGIAGKTEQPESPAQLLPDGVLGRCVCGATVDTRRTLRADLLPISTSGVFVDISGSTSGFFSLPSAARAIRSMLKGSPFDDWARAEIMDHCNPLAQRVRA